MLIRNRPVLRKIFFLALFFGLGCSSGNIQTRHSTDLGVRKIKRIVILPPPVTASESSAKGALAPNASPAKPSEKEAPEILARLLYSTMASVPNWQIVSEGEAREVFQSVRAAGEAARLKELGERVYADGVLAGRVVRFRERVGEEWGVKSPASVAFVIELVDVRRGDVVWSARFDETQKSLSENILAIGDIGQRGVRWLTAEQLMHEGVKKAVGQLHELLARPPG